MQPSFDVIGVKKFSPTILYFQTYLSLYILKNSLGKKTQDKGMNNVWKALLFISFENFKIQPLLSLYSFFTAMSSKKT